MEGIKQDGLGSWQLPFCTGLLFEELAIDILLAFVEMVSPDAKGGKGVTSYNIRQTYRSVGGGLGYWNLTSSPSKCCAGGLESADSARKEGTQAATCWCDALVCR